MAQGDFCDLITDMAYGQVHQQLTEQMREVVEAVEATGLQGKLVLTLNVKREGKVATVGASVKLSVPQHPLPATIFYFDRDGTLAREDPRQMSLGDVVRVPELTPIRLEKGRDQ